MSEKVTIKVERKELHLPTIALRGLVVFPNNLVHFEVGREKSIAAVEWAMANNSNVFLVAQKEMETSEPTQQDLYTYGVVAEVKQVLRVSDELVKVLVEGKYRAKLTELDTTGDFLLSAVRSAPVRAAKPEEAVETEALLRALKTGFDEYLGMNPRLAKDVVFTIVSSDDPMFLTEYMPANLLFRYEDKQAVMNENTLNGRLQRLVEMLRRECQVMKIEKEIAEKVNESMDKNQRDYYLREQLHVIREELGEDDNDNSLVLRLTADAFTLLLMGDATANIERLLLSEDAALDADVLKVGHHGKDDASLAEFLSAVSPRVALVTGSHSDGDTSPSQAVLARLAEAGALVYSNDTDLLAVELILGSTGVLEAVEHAW